MCVVYVTKIKDIPGIYSCTHPFMDCHLGNNVIMLLWLPWKERILLNAKLVLMVM